MAEEEDRKFLCSLCPKRFKRSSHLRRHVQNAHASAKEFPCHVCHKTFAGPEQLRRHEKRHGEKTHACTLCDRKFLKLARLQEHVQKIHGPFPCVFCAEILHGRKNFRLHMKLYHWETRRKPPGSEAANAGSLVCEICGKKFPRERSLKAHMRLKHTAATCVDCGATFTQRRNLNAHIKRMHADAPKQFPCHLCGKSFAYKHVLERHIRKLHPPPPVSDSASISS